MSTSFDDILYLISISIILISSMIVISQILISLLPSSFIIYGPLVININRLHSERFSFYPMASLNNNLIFSISISYYLY